MTSLTAKTSEKRTLGSNRNVPIEVYAKIFTFLPSYPLSNVLLSSRHCPGYYIEKFRLAFIEGHGNWFEVLTLFRNVQSPQAAAQLQAFLKQTLLYWGDGSDGKKIKNNVLIYLMVKWHLAPNALKMMIDPPKELRGSIGTLKKSGWAFNPAANHNLALTTAVEKGNEKTVKILMTDKRVDPASGDNYLIRRVCWSGSTEIVRLLLEDPRVDPSTWNNDPIHSASSSGHVKIVKLLLQHPRVNPASYKNYAIRMAALNGHADVVELLLNDSRVDPSALQNTAIRDASRRRHGEVIKMLLADQRVFSTLSERERVYYKNRLASFSDWY